MVWKKYSYTLVGLILGLALLIQGCSITQSSTSNAPFATQEKAPYTLTILHTSENHGHWEPVDISKVSQGGVARRAALVEKLRSQVTNSLLLDSGNISQGTLYFTQYKGTEGRDFYNLLGYDSIVLGNHDFDLGPKTLAENFLSDARFSVVLSFPRNAVFR